MAILDIDTEILRSSVATAQQTNEAITEALNLLNQVVLHNDWQCAERNQINANTLANRQTAQEIQNNTSAFYHAVGLASSKFDEAEQNTIRQTNQVDNIIGGIVNVVPGISGAADSIASNIQIVQFDGIQDSLEG